MHGCVALTGIDMYVYPDRCHACTWIQSPSIHRNIYINVCGHPSIFRYTYFGAAPSVCGGCARGCARVVCICLRVQSPLPNAPVCLSRACVCACMRGDFLWLRPVRPHVRPLFRGGRGPHARAVRGRRVASTKVKALPEWLGQCMLLEDLCVPRPPRRRHARSQRCRRGAVLLRVRDRRAVRGGSEPPGAAARLARRYAQNTELAELPAAADWPSLKIL
jgi:hypothetical protein